MNTLVPVVVLLQAAGLAVVAGSLKGRPAPARNGEIPDRNELARRNELTREGDTSTHGTAVRDVARRLAVRPDTADAIIDADPGYVQRLRRYDAACRDYWRASDDPDWDLAYLLTRPYPRFPFPATPLPNEPITLEDRDQMLHHLQNIGVLPHLAQVLVDHDPWAARYLLRIAHDADALDELSQDIEETVGSYAANLFRRINQPHGGVSSSGPTPHRALEPGSGSARQVVNEMVDDGLLDDLMKQVGREELALTGPGGFLPELVKAVLESGLQAELATHLGYEKHDPAGRGTPNFRNGSRPRAFATEVGTIQLDVPRDRNSTFTPRLIPKGSRRLGGLWEAIVSLYIGGMTTRDFHRHLTETLGAGLSPDTISKIANAMANEIKAWQTRRLGKIYPLLYPDTVRVKVRDGDEARAKAAQVVVGIDLNGAKHVLGIWMQTAEGATSWTEACTALRNRGVRDVLIAYASGQSGFADAVDATWPQTAAQTCTLHLIQAAIRYALQ